MVFYIYTDKVTWALDQDWTPDLFEVWIEPGTENICGGRIVLEFKQVCQQQPVFFIRENMIDKVKESSKKQLI